MPQHLTCRSCGARITWGELNGKPHPFDDDGTSHFATCPDADTWRKQRGGPATEVAEQSPFFQRVFLVRDAESRRQAVGAASPVVRIPVLGDPLPQRAGWLVVRDPEAYPEPGGGWRVVVSYQFKREDNNGGDQVDFLDRSSDPRHGSEQ